MSNPITKRTAIIIDEKPCGSQKGDSLFAERALRRGGYTIHKICTAPNQTQTEQIQKLSPRIGGADSLVIYISAAEEKNSTYYSGVDTLKSLNALRYGTRTVIANVPQGHLLARFFESKPRTLFIASNATTEQRKQFSGLLWELSDRITDINNDGAIGWQERFIHLFKNGGANLASTFSKTYDFTDYDIERGKTITPPHPATPINVATSQELQTQLNRLHHSDYAVVFYADPQSPALLRDKAAFSEIARKAGGNFLFVWAEFKTQSKNTTHELHGTTKIVDSRGKFYHCANLRQLPQKLFNPPTRAIATAMADLKNNATIGDKQSVAKLQNALRLIVQDSQYLSTDDVKHILPHLNNTIKGDVSELHGLAARTYAAITRHLTHEEVSTVAKELRETFSSDGDRVRLHALNAYFHLSSHLNETELISAIQPLRHLHRHNYQPVREAAARVYRSLIARIPQRIIKREAQMLRALFFKQHAGIAGAAMASYATIGSRLSPEELSRGARALRMLFKLRTIDTWRQHAALEAYGALAQFMRAQDLALGARVLRGLFEIKNGWTRELVDEAYKKIGTQLPAYNAAHEMAVIRRLLSDQNPWSRELLINAYDTLSEGIGPAVRAREASLLLKQFQHHNESIRSGAMLLYYGLISNTPSENIYEAAILLRTLMQSRCHAEQSLASMVYSRVAGYLPAAHIDSEAQELHRLFGSKYRANTVAAINVFSSLAPRISSDLAEKSAPLLRLHFNDRLKSVRYYAVFAYRILAKHHPVVSRSAEGARDLRLLWRGSFSHAMEDSHSRAEAITTYAELAQNLSIGERGQGVNDLRERFKDNSYTVRYAALNAYMKLAPQLGICEIRRGISDLKTLRSDRDKRFAEFIIQLLQRLEAQKQVIISGRHDVTGRVIRGQSEIARPPA